MKRLMIAASIALIAGMGAADAKTSRGKKAHVDRGGSTIQHKLSVGPTRRGARSDPATTRRSGPIKTGAQPEYPQSPPGGY